MTKTNQLIREAYDKGFRATTAGAIVSHRGVELKASAQKSGFMLFPFYSSNGSATIPVHKFAAYCLHGERALSRDMCVVHYDGNRENNSSGNLEVCEWSEAKRGMIGIARAPKRRAMGLPEKAMAQSMRARGATLAKIANELGCSIMTASKISRQS